MIKINFEVETEHGMFKDALSLEDDHGLTDLQIEELKQQRVDDWISHITTIVPDTGEREPSPMPHELLGHKLQQISN